MKTRRAIFWATMAIIFTIQGVPEDGVMKYVIAGALTISLLMLWAQTKGKNEDD